MPHKILLGIFLVSIEVIYHAGRVSATSLIFWLLLLCHPCFCSIHSTDPLQNTVHTKLVNGYQDRGPGEF